MGGASSGRFALYAFNGSDTVPCTVYSGNSVSNLILIAGADGREAAFSAMAGIEYEIAVTSWSESGENYVLKLRPGPPNDAFANRLPLTGTSLTATGYNFGATLETDEFLPHEQNLTRSVWWSWRAPANLTVSIDTVGSSLNASVLVYTGTSLTNLTAVTSSYDVARFAALSGTTYHIAVCGWYFPNSGDITLNLSAVPPPSNDAFANRIPLSGTTATANVNNADATVEFGEPDHAGSSAARTVWWKWVAPVNGTVTLDSTASSFTPLLAVYTGSSVSNLFLITSSVDGYRNGCDCDVLCRGRDRVRNRCGWLRKRGSQIPTSRSNHAI
jgi:hypothetical protein